MLNWNLRYRGETQLSKALGAAHNFTRPEQKPLPLQGEESLAHSALVFAPYGYMTVGSPTQTRLNAPTNARHRAFRQ